MRTAPENKYTDRDVREDPKLKELAIAYVRTYGGEFEPLVRAQNMLEADCDLTTAMTRTVLNCMRVDAHIASTLPAPRGYFIPGARAGVIPPELPKPRKRQRLHVRFKLRRDYWMNFHRQARWYHKVDHTATSAWFYPAGWNGAVPADMIAVHEIYGVCGRRLSYGEPHSEIELMDASEARRAAEAFGVEYCPRCKAGKRDAGWKP